MTCKTQPASLLRLPQEHGNLSSGLFGELKLQSAREGAVGEGAPSSALEEGGGVEACPHLPISRSTCLARKLHADRILPFNRMVFDQWQPWWLWAI